MRAAVCATYGPPEVVRIREVPLDQIVDAHRYVETGQKVGGVVIRVDQSG